MRPYAKTTHDGKTVDYLTKVALMAAEAILGYELSITQGSFNDGKVPASGTIHNGGGAVDLPPFDAENKVRVLRRLGFAAWVRTPDQGPWPEHVHAVQVGNARLDPSAVRQVKAYLEGRNGLASNAPDDGPRRHVKTAAKTTARFEAALRETIR